MLDVVMLAAAIVARIPPTVLGVLATVIFAPAPFGVAVVGGLAVFAARRSARPAVDGESVFLRAVAAELRAGATLRAAMIVAADRAPELELASWVRHAVAGRPLSELVQPLEERLPISGRATAAAIDLLATSGGAAGDVFTRLAAQTDVAIALQRERRTSSAQARLSAAVVAAAPLPVLAWLMVRGTFADLLASGGGIAVLSVGLGLELAGVGVTVWILRRVR